MRIKIYLGAIFILLAGCETLPELKNDPDNVLDLSHDKDLAEQYWVVSKNVAPNYPKSAVAQQVTGCTRFKVIIASTGEPVGIQLLESFPVNTFESVSKRALKKWRWVTSSHNIAKQSIITTVQLDFFNSNAKNFAQAKSFCTV
jgi:hypothetical protein